MTVSIVALGVLLSLKKVLANLIEEGITVQEGF